MRSDARQDRAPPRGTFRALRDVRPLASALLFGGAFGCALLYRGEFGLETVSLCAALVLLYAWLLSALTGALRAGAGLRIDAIAFSLLLWWIWLAGSLVGHPAPYTGILVFWILSCLPLAFLAGAASARRDAAFRLGFGVLAAVAAGLAAHATWQYGVEGTSPQSLFRNQNSHATLLNLVALPLIGFCVAGDGPAARRRAALLAPLVFALIFSVATVRGRATSGALWLAIGLLFAVAAYAGLVRRRLVRWGAVAALCVAAFAAGELAPPQHGRGLRYRSSVTRLAELAERPASGLADRMRLWRVAGELIEEAPVRGEGLGTFHVHLAPRHPVEDPTPGYHAHSDYLELAVDAGIPAAALLALVGLTALIGVGRLLRSPRVPGDVKLEAGGLAAGLFAVALHSAVSFNLYQPAILIAMGLVLGRLQTLAAERDVRVGAAPTVVVWAGSLVSVALIAGVGVAAWSHHQARSGGAGTPVQEVERLLDRANRFAPEMPAVLVSQARLRLAQIELGLASSPDEIRALEAQGLAFTDRAARVGPFRPETPQARAALLQADPDLDPPQKLAHWEAAYEQVLELDPRACQQRVRLARLLLGAGRLDEARRVLEGGVRFSYPRGGPCMPYLSLAARLRFQAGDLEGGAELAQRVDRMLEWRGRTPDYGERLRREFAAE